MGICPLLVFVSSVHSTLGNRAANLNGRKKKKQTTQCNVSLTNTNAQARCLAEPQSEKAVKASGFLQTGLIT